MIVSLEKHGPGCKCPACVSKAVVKYDWYDTKALRMRVDCVEWTGTHWNVYFNVFNRSTKRHLQRTWLTLENWNKYSTYWREGKAV